MLHILYNGCKDYLLTICIGLGCLAANANLSHFSYTCDKCDQIPHKCDKFDHIPLTCDGYDHIPHMCDECDREAKHSYNNFSTFFRSKSRGSMSLYADLSCWPHVITGCIMPQTLKKLKGDIALGVCVCVCVCPCVRSKINLLLQF